MSIESRPFAGEPDLPAILALHQAIAARFPHVPPMNEAAVRTEYLDVTPGYRVDLRLWEEDERLVGLGKVMIPDEQEGRPIAYVRPRVRPDTETALVGGEIVAWAEQVAADRLGGSGQIEVTFRRDNTAMIEFVRARGYHQDRVFLQLERSLEQPVPTLALPEGYHLRPTAGEAEIDDWIALYNSAFRDHYDFRPWSREGKAQWMNDPAYLPELDVVAVAPDGTLAALCWTSRLDPEDGAPSWFVELVATAREHRRKGLGSALIANAIGQVAALGGESLKLVVDATSETGANRIYERQGFVEVSVLLDFRRELSGMTPLGN